MTDTPARLLRLLTLLQNPRDWPGTELAARLEVSPRTVRRDVERIRDLGYPVHATMGAFGGYRLAAGSALPPLLLADDEAVAIAVGLRTAARQPVAGIAEASVRALATLQRVLPTRLRRQIGALGAATVAPPPAPGGADQVDPEQLTALATGIAAGERVRFDYRAGDGTASRRLVEPHRLVPVHRHWYLLAYDSERHDWRTFRVDRITATHPTGVRVPPRDPPSGDAAAYVRDRLYDLAPVYVAVATIRLPAAAAASRLGAAAGELTAVDEGTCRWRSPADTLEWLGFRLALTGAEFAVEEPVELVAHLRDLAGRIARGAGTAGLPHPPA